MNFSFATLLLAALGDAGLCVAERSSPFAADPSVPASGMETPCQNCGPYAPRTAWERIRTRQIITDGRGKRRIHRAAPVPAESVAVIDDIAYGPDPSQRLDLYLPSAARFPFVVYIHGGSWISEDKAMYTVFGRYLASHGLGAAIINYRLPPGANVEDQVRDGAAAVAWTRRCVARYGGDPQRIFLCGHSAGGHLVAVLATNAHYLGAEGLCPGDIRGVIAMGGVFEIGLNTSLFGVGYAFKNTDRRALSPIRHLDRCPPPFLLMEAQNGRRYLQKQAWRFQRSLSAIGQAAECFIVPCEDHYGQVLEIAVPGSVQGLRILDFISRHGAPGAR